MSLVGQFSFSFSSCMHPACSRDSEYVRCKRLNTSFLYKTHRKHCLYLFSHFYFTCIIPLLKPDHYERCTLWIYTIPFKKKQYLFTENKIRIGHIVFMNVSIILGIIVKMLIHIKVKHLAMWQGEIYNR